MRALEIFIADTSKLSGLAGVATTAAAAFAHFVALEEHPSPFTTPRFLKMMRVIGLNHSKVAKPKKPFTREDIMTFMDLAYAGKLVEWRAAFLMALCFQQLLRGAECFDLSGANVVITAVGFKVTVETSKNHPEGFEFNVPVEDQLHDVGLFMVDYIGVMGIRVGDAGSHFVCKLAKVKGILKAYPGVRVADATMRKACKVLIVDSGLDPTLYTTHSCKRGAALQALKAGLTDIQIQDLGRWTSASMVARYAGG
jgi:integrase